MNNEVLYKFLYEFVYSLYEDGYTGKYTFNFTEDIKNNSTWSKRTILVLSDRSGTEVRVYYNLLKLVYWDDLGVHHVELFRFPDEETRFQESLVRENVLSTENEMMLQSVLKDIAEYIRDDLGLFNEKIW